uniref:Mitochondrial inner membrane protease ATP23 n=1 Tax=Petromyzon marinus TaxID=7757 RepID=A0AAJ7WVL5_PETMA|nr:mitochondrial inner membrane protease ATP23 homolog [Petromyzon marinus]
MAAPMGNVGDAAPGNGDTGTRGSEAGDSTETRGSGGGDGTETRGSGGGDGTETRGSGDERHGLHLFPERLVPKFKRGFAASAKCNFMLKVALESNPYAILLQDALKRSGCTAYRDRHFSCEECDNKVAGGFDSHTSQVVICQNNVQSQHYMNRVVTHELIHAFDHCRAHVDWFGSMEHMACSEIRAANLSGDCTFQNELRRFNFGLKGHHQTCVRNRAALSILAVRPTTIEEAKAAVDRVFEPCFNDLEPFGRIPLSKKHAKYAFLQHQSRDRYEANL